MNHAETGRRSIGSEISSSGQEDHTEFPASGKMRNSLPTRTIQHVSRLRCYQVDPIADPRWTELVERHPKASVFHTVGWLQALRRTYGYGPVAFTTSSPAGDLKNGLVFCHIKSWLTGRRLVSLPFSDHCEPLCDSTEEMNFLMSNLQATLEQEEWGYLEVRPINGNFSQVSDGIAFLPAANYFLHRLNLRPDLNEVFRSLDKDSVQRRIQRAERAGLVEKCGRSDELLKEFYALFVVMRRRHGLPPIPYAWFQNLIHFQDKALEIRLACKDKIPIAAILTLQFKDTVYYKYGCSDTRFNKYGATSWLLWRAIASGKSNGANEFDMGRTQEDNAGLLAFKDHWVPQAERLVYWKYPDSCSLVSFDRWPLRLAKHIFSRMPKRLLTMTGRLIYRHIG
jgi:Acetyltransferase (GNAT) domain